MTHTAQDLLAAVGVDWKAKYARIFCPECSMNWNPETRPGFHHSTCRRPDTSNVEPTYTGPALGTPELDAVLLVAGFKWMLEHGQHEARIIVQHNPGHALAEGIAEVRG